MLIITFLKWLVLPSPFQSLGVASLKGLAHISIPQNRTPCGRRLCRLLVLLTLACRT